MRWSSTTARTRSRVRSGTSVRCPARGATPATGPTGSGSGWSPGRPGGPYAMGVPSGERELRGPRRTDDHSRRGASRRDSRTCRVLHASTRPAIRGRPTASVWSSGTHDQTRRVGVLRLQAPSTSGVSQNPHRDRATAAPPPLRRPSPADARSGQAILDEHDDTPCRPVRTSASKGSASFPRALPRRGCLLRGSRRAQLADGGQRLPPLYSAVGISLARLAAGDLVVATEAGARTLAVRCAGRCTIRQVAAGPPPPTAKGHITFVPGASYVTGLDTGQEAG